METDVGNKFNCKDLHGPNSPRTDPSVERSDRTFAPGPPFRDMALHSLLVLGYLDVHAGRPPERLFRFMSLRKGRGPVFHACKEFGLCLPRALESLCLEIIETPWRGCAIRVIGDSRGGGRKWAKGLTPEAQGC